MKSIEIHDSPAIGDDIAVKSPPVPQNPLNEFAASATGIAAKAVVGTHHRLGMRLNNRCSERGKIRLEKVAITYQCVKDVTDRLGPAVNRKVLWSGDRLEIPRVISLHSLHEFHRQPPREIWIFTVGFHPPAPAGIAENVDVGRPERKAFIDFRPPFSERPAVFGPCFVGDNRGNAEHQIGIPGRGKANCLGKHRGLSGSRHTMKGFTPPVVGRNAQTFNGRGIVEHLLHLLL